jgi:hypothetical protein
MAPHGAALMGLAGYGEADVESRHSARYGEARRGCDWRGEDGLTWQGKVAELHGGRGLARFGADGSGEAGRCKADEARHGRGLVWHVKPRRGWAVPGMAGQGNGGVGQRGRSRFLFVRLVSNA